LPGKIKFFPTAYAACVSPKYDTKTRATARGGVRFIIVPRAFACGLIFFVD